MVRPIAYSELPPRARRILIHDTEAGPRIGTTSACAENTVFRASATATWRNYLRVRGEYNSGFRPSFFHLELPPRARRIQSKPHAAESLARNYLRVRGEYNAMNGFMAITAELPPRARRIHTEQIVPIILSGTTSACAENTWGENPKIHSHRNYLRVRGEYRVNSPVNGLMRELPPRARRIHHQIRYSP